MDNRKIIATNLKRLRLERGLTGEQVGKMIGLSHSVIWEIECRSRRLSADEVFTLAKNFEVPINEFFKGCI
jgi:transcriptional regulator with XRE-family HTH domain